MPIMSCSSGGKSGYKWGNSGHCYTGPNARARAAAQAAAAYANGYKGDGKEYSSDDIADMISIMGILSSEKENGEK